MGMGPSMESTMGLRASMGMGSAMGMGFTMTSASYREASDPMRAKNSLT